MKLDLAPVFEAAQSHGASDILLTADAPPILRIAGELVHLEMPPLDADAARKQIYSLLSDREIAELERLILIVDRLIQQENSHRVADASFDLEQLARQLSDRLLDDFLN